MKTKACVIITYFGTLPETIDTFMQSCRNNSDFNWIVFTDCIYKKAPGNVKFVSMALNDLKLLIENKLNMKVSLERPYKMCDFRPAYGIIFEDYLKEYDFWGYGDFDVIYGKLSNFLNDDIFNAYDKIYTCGHLSFIRNNDKCNNVYKLHTNNSWDYTDVFTDSTSWIFDEYRGINEKLIKWGAKIYSKYEFIDVDVSYKRMRRADKKTINRVFRKYLFKKQLPINYEHQIFIWEDGKTYNVYFDENRDLKKEEVVYIHYRKKIPYKSEGFSQGRFIISNTGIICTDEAMDRALIDKYNKFEGKKVERLEYRQALRNSIITELGKREKLVKTVRKIKGMLGITRKEGV